MDRKTNGFFWQIMFKYEYYPQCNDGYNVNSQVGFHVAPMEDNQWNPCELNNFYSEEGCSP